MMWRRRNPALPLVMHLPHATSAADAHYDDLKTTLFRDAKNLPPVITPSEKAHLNLMRHLIDTLIDL